MIRALHRGPGLAALILVTLLALSGAALSLFPLREQMAAPPPVAGQSVADLAARVAATHPGLEDIRRAPSGRITAGWFAEGAAGSAVIDPVTGADAGSADPDPVERWLTNLHRSLFLGDAGRIAMAAGAAALLALAVSGAVLVARRAGGWRRWCAPLRGQGAGRLHVALARVALPALFLSAVTGLWMTASTFDLLPDGAARPPEPAALSGRTGFPLDRMEALRTVPVAALRNLRLPAEGDAQDVITLVTDQGTALIDQGTGRVVAEVPMTAWQRLSDLMTLLHTGRGATVLGLVMGLMALVVPVMGVTGALIWAMGRRSRARPRDNVAPAKAETVILVGSEGGSTWGFAATLAQGLRAAGQAVHVAPMSAFDPGRIPAARAWLILTATYGEGDAPASAQGFLDRLAAIDRAPQAPLAVLGFGDRSFPEYCAFAEQVAAEAQARGWATLLPLDRIDRQSPQAFARWGEALGAALGLPLRLDHQPVRPATEALRLISRRDYGAEVQAPTAILRFAVPRAGLWARLTGRGFARFQAGDLLGIVPQGDSLPRFYSLASSHRDGFIEIVVRKRAGGLCSGQLMDLAPGDSVTGFLRENSAFRPGRAPLLLVGAGTGIGALAGLIRANGRRRPVHLVMGMRHADSDFLYREDLAGWQAEGQLTRLTTAFSRGARPHYVQDALRMEAGAVAEAVAQGGRVMVCGGRDMAQGVARALAEILAPHGLSPATLRAQGRYVEDVY